jgi:hypothetical protein
MILLQILCVVITVAIVVLLYGATYKLIQENKKLHTVDTDTDEDLDLPKPL